jgi:hypothetical protein
VLRPGQIREAVEDDEFQRLDRLAMSLRQERAGGPETSLRVIQVIASQDALVLLIDPGQLQVLLEKSVRIQR